MEESMFIVSWMLFGLVVGLIAKLLMRTRPQSLLVTSLLGIAGSLLGGFLGRVLGFYPSYRSTGSFITSIFGAVIILAISNAVAGRHGAPAGRGPLDKGGTSSM
jgi:uncharacterized membrane protein YeaQ/YmgE (transglycosylase-associated protein family)